MNITETWLISFFFFCVERETRRLRKFRRKFSFIKRVGTSKGSGEAGGVQPKNFAGRVRGVSFFSLTRFGGENVPA